MVRGHRVVMVEMYPVQYSPGTGRLSVYSEMQVRINLRGSDMAATRAGFARYRSVPFDESYRGSLLNRENLEFQIEGQPALPIGYLVIVGDTYYNGTLPLVDWKHKKGFVTTVTKTSQIPGGPTADNIRAYILDAYNNWPIPPTYVLLVGDSDVIPGFTGSSSRMITDLNYSTMNPEDIFPDVMIGRFPVASTANIATMVEKVMDYEQVAWSQGYAWAQKGYFMASDDPFNHRTAEGTHNYCMALARANGMTCDSLYDYYGTGTPIATAVNSGRSMAIYSGHGSNTSWGGPSFNQSNVRALTNLDKYPLVCSHACNTGNFSTGECFGETWVREDDKGAIAFWGSAPSTYWDEDDILQRRMFDEIFDSSLTWLGGMMDKAKYDLWVNYGGGGRSTYYYQAYNLFGDPSMDLFTLVPATLNVSYPAEFVIGQTQFTVTVAGVAGALVCSYTSDFSVFETGYTDAMGKVVLHPDPVTTGTLYITVTAHNRAPHQGSVPIISPSGPYVQYVAHRIDDDNSGTSVGNSSAVPNPGETVELPVLVKNFGVQTALSVVGTLSIPGGDPYVTITDATETFGNIVAGDSIWTPDDFDFVVSSSCPHAHPVNFRLTLTGTNGSWTSDFSVLVSGVTITATPDQTSVPRGGSLGLTLDIYNHTSSALSVDRWADVYLPDGSPYSRNPVIGPTNVSIPGLGTVSAHINRRVPRRAELGDYTLCGRTGTYPGSMVDEDCFTFTVTP
jgi:hypothetical protein